MLPKPLLPHLMSVIFPAKQLSQDQHGIRQRRQGEGAQSACLPAQTTSNGTAGHRRVSHRNVLALLPTTYTLNRHNEPNKNTPSNAEAEHLNWANAGTGTDTNPYQAGRQAPPTLRLQLPQHLKCQIRLNYLTLRRRRRQFMSSSGEILIGIDSPPGLPRRLRHRL